MITLYGKASNAFTNSEFSLQYMCTLSSLQEASTVLEPYSSNVNFDIKMNMGYGMIEPLQIGGYQLARTTLMKWHLTPKGYESIETLGPLIISLSNFEIPKTDGICQAVLTIYDDDTEDGEKLFDGCTNDRIDRWFFVDSQKSLIVFAVGDNNLLSSTSFRVTWFIDNPKYKCGTITQPISLRENSFILTDGSQSTEQMRLYESCSWIIDPFDSGGKLRLLVDKYIFKSGGSILVYDGNSDAGILLWGGNGDSTTVPPPLISSSGKMYITYQSDGRVPDAEQIGFRAVYGVIKEGSRGMGSGDEILAASSAIGLRPPGNFEDLITPSVEYTYYIEPANLPSGTITFAFGYLNLNCTNSNLLIIDGPSISDNVIGSYCGSTLPISWLQTSGNSAVLLFSPGDSSTGNFDLSYWSDGPNYHCGFQNGPDPAILTATSMKITDGSSSAEDVYSNEQCVWRIAPREGASIVIFFERFSLRGATLSFFVGDSVTDARDLIITLTDSDAIPAPIVFPRTLFSGDAIISVLYWSTSSPAGKGFSLTYYSNSYSASSVPSFSFPGDNFVQLFCSSSVHVPVPTAADGRILQGNFTWDISPSYSISHGSKIYISIYFLNLASGHDLKFIGSESGEIASFDHYSQDVPSKWLISTMGETIFMNLRSGLNTLSGNFKMSYYSDGNNINCGLSIMDGEKFKGTINSPSMIISDGSSAFDVMHPNQQCEWTIAPEIPNGRIIFELLENDLRGGAKMSIFDGDSDEDRLLWHCNGCDVLPGPIISSSPRILISFDSSHPSGELGLGFLGFYWVLYDEDIYPDSDNGTLLTLPYNVGMTNSLQNSTSMWSLEAIETESHLYFSPRFSAPKIGSSSYINDGRSADDNNFESIDDTVYLCGFVDVPLNQAPIYLHQEGPGGFSSLASQHAASYLTSSTEDKEFFNVYPESDNLTISSVLQFPSIGPSSTCKYHVHSGSERALAITVSEFRSNAAGNLHIYGGLYADDSVLLTSLAQDVYGGEYIAPCGKAIILLELNSTEVAEHSLKLKYKLVDNDNGQICAEYRESLLPKEEEYDPTVDILIVLGTFLFIFLFLVGVVFYQRNKHLLKKKRVYKILSPYPRYSPSIDEFRNQFLPKGKCVVCQDSPVQVFKLKCQHAICAGDLKGYLEAALGDISMFPVKCPMHYEGCPGHLLASIAKRVLSRSQYDRFIEFSDRAQYGDGMRCAHCNNYVNFPSDTSISMVSCPFCTNKFCMRCKKPWHFAGNCPLESANDDLEQWKERSGAQKCPVCTKIIEKDDPDTCNHIVHKITDGIPCIRDRTDFCCTNFMLSNFHFCILVYLRNSISVFILYSSNIDLCGYEVTPDYPHEEVDNPGVNHFPEGVFQICRVMKQRQKDEERDKLRRTRRNRKPSRSPNAFNDSRVVALYSDDWES